MHERVQKTGPRQKENHRPASLPMSVPGPDYSVLQKRTAAIQDSPYLSAQYKRLSAAFDSSPGMTQQKRDSQISEGTVPENEQMPVISDTFSTKISKPDADQLIQKKTAKRTENKTGIPDEVKARMESAFGTDFSGVQVHPNSPAAPSVGALAYTQGSDIHFAPGQFSPNTSAGKRLLGHELAHVQQQSQGRVKPTTEVNGLPVNDSPVLEEEADRLGSKAAG